MSALVAAVVVALLSAPAPVPAQQWSTQQQEVWAAVEALWDTSNDVDAWYDLIADDYRGWSISSAAPSTKAATRPFSERWAARNETVALHLFPLAIDVRDDIAVVFYTYEGVYAQSDGTDRPEKGRWTDIYQNVGGRWLLVADCGGEGA